MGIARTSVMPYGLCIQEMKSIYLISDTAIQYI